MKVPTTRTSWLMLLLALGRRVVTHIDYVLHAVVDVSLARLQGGGVGVADHCLGETRLILINYEVPRGHLLAAENLALQHPFSIPQNLDGPAGARDGDDT
jgi:hypothetical protein